MHVYLDADQKYDHKVKIYKSNLKDDLDTDNFCKMTFIC